MPLYLRAFRVPLQASLHASDCDLHQISREVSVPNLTLNPNLNLSVFWVEAIIQNQFAAPLRRNLRVVAEFIRWTRSSLGNILFDLPQKRIERT
jgi:hypothetical protein